MPCIGIDFDNTLACYDNLFHQVALEKQLVNSTIATKKSAVKKAIQKRYGNSTWVELQGSVYGERILEAPPFVGTNTFLTWCRVNDIQIKIISHKTQFAVANEALDLRLAARNWLEHHKIMNLGGIQDNDISFHETRDEKVQQIIKSQCDIFIDDLIEVLEHPHFPQDTQGVLIHGASLKKPMSSKHKNKQLHACADWSELLAYCKKRFA